MTPSSPMHKKFYSNCSGTANAQFDVTVCTKGTFAKMHFGEFGFGALCFTKDFLE